MNLDTFRTDSQFASIATVALGTTAVAIGSTAAACLDAAPTQTIAVSAAGAVAATLLLARYIATGGPLGSNRRADEAMELWQRRLDRFVRFGEARLLTPLAVVTGSNSGVGMSSAENLMACGWRVVMACRNQKAAEDARRTIVTAAQSRLATRYSGLTDPAQKARAAQLVAAVAANATISALDVSDVGSIRAFAKELAVIEGGAGADSGVAGLATYHDGLRLLMNNAGLFQHGYGKWSPQGVEGMFNTNYAGPAYLTHLVMRDIVKPRIAAQKSSSQTQTPFRVIDLSSSMHGLAFLGLSNDEIEQTLAAMADRTQTLENNSLLRKMSNTYGVSKFAMVVHAANIKAEAEKEGWAADGLVTAYSVHPGGVRTAVFRGLKGLLSFGNLLLGHIIFKSQHNGASNQTYLALALIKEQAEKDPLTKSVCEAAGGTLSASERLGDSTLVSASTSGRYMIDIGEAQGAGQISHHANADVYKIFADWTDKIVARFEAI